MKNIILLTIVISGIIISGCRSSKNITMNNILIELETTSCYGTCPVYKLIIYQNGHITLNGIKHMDYIGEHTSMVDKTKLENIISSFDKSSFFNFNDEYRSLFKDLPTKYISYHKDGELKKIMAYDNIPKELNHLILILENLIKELDWEKVK